MSFDNPPTRVGTNAFKYNITPYPVNKTVPIHPHWVADMDFQAPPAIREALTDLCKLGIFGYSSVPNELYRNITRYLSTHGWDFTEDRLKQSLMFSPGVVSGIGLVLHAITKEGDAVLFNTPSYPHFFESVTETHRKVVVNKMVHNGDTWDIDFEELEKQIVSEDVKVYIFCSPHNPTGKVFTQKELEKVVSICHRHHVVIISDEIHCDIILPDHRHIHTATVDTAEDITITFLAPSKTYNIPGLNLAFMLCTNNVLYKKVSEYACGLGVSFGNLFGFEAMTVAYSGLCEDWRLACVNYIHSNGLLVRHYLQQYLPNIHVTLPNATFLLWLDFSNLNLENDEIDKRLADRGIVFNQGKSFGNGFEYFRRFNIAAPQTEIQSVLNLLRDAFQTN
ncbi:hypothetical protein EIN_523440 [Entamoeba invadens IP1]|uniref:cysteine-S-conjugate beta-lyase n=1 Tax=Entamoeba invadens IP1 TaxID=370355 RepID=A0A0A1UB98_ENTIV|nr:hypothetical protein EIN_523440 [Entamoeba invadens IP1]ELP92456.1 hypothetical protein EIN_523440 [Entamoeba invadens IP1]|eukprot:XP_004259227.1 hypothetical protein EIN_523440 [Entamoeba invadens IP1]